MHAEFAKRGGMVLADAFSCPLQIRFFCQGLSLWIFVVEACLVRLSLIAIAAVFVARFQ